MLPGVAVAIGIDVKEVSKAIPLCRVVKNVVVGCIAGAKDEAEHDSCIFGCSAWSWPVRDNSSSNGGAEDFSKRKTVSQGK